MRRLVGNRKGDLTENALSLIVAVLGLALLFFAAWKIYDYMAGAEARDAKKTIEFIESRAEEIKVGETSKVVIKGIKGWFFSGWAADDPSRPDKCLLNSCLCVCEGIISITPGKSYPGIATVNKGGDVSDPLQAAGSCQENGFCKELNADKLEIKLVNYYTMKSESAGYGGVTTSNMVSGEFSFLNFNATNLYEMNMTKVTGSNGKITLKITRST